MYTLTLNGKTSLAGASAQNVWAVLRLLREVKEMGCLTVRGWYEIVAGGDVIAQGLV
jgi:hypothetical protein